MADLLKELHLSKFIAFDLETTGLDPSKDTVIEFSAILFENGKATKTLSFLCNSRISISSEITDLTGITPEMLKGKPPFEERLPEVIDFFDEIPLVAHNIKFDLGFLKHYCRRHKNFKKAFFRNQIYDTLLLSQAFYFYLHNHRLGTVSEYCGLSSENAHRAETDAYNTGRIFLQLISEVIKYDLETLQTINAVLKDTDDPNKWLYHNAAQRLVLSKSLGEKPVPKVDWNPPLNLYGFSVGSSREKWGPVNYSTIKQYFGKKGILSGVLDHFESRKQQLQMAEYVWESLNEGKSAVIEAGTGVGKTLAYLIPAILWQKSQTPDHSRVVIASNTKTLQEQIFFKEIPFICDKVKLPFKAVLLKGRSNYICLTRWNRLLADIGNRVHISNRSAVIPIIIWLKHTKTGDISENNGFRSSQYYSIWNEICSEPGYCTTSVCQKYDGCYLGKVRFYTNSADIIVVNHSLLLSDAAANNTVIPEYEGLIIDEAHNLESNSYNYFSAKINIAILSTYLKTLFNTKPVEHGLLVDVQQLMIQFKNLAKVESDIIRLKDQISDLRIAAETFFKAVFQHSASRLTKNRGYSLKRRFKIFSAEFPDLKTEPQTFLYELSNTIKMVKSLVEKIDEQVKELPTGFDELRIRLVNVIEGLEEYLKTFRTIRSGNDESLIFWYEVHPNIYESGVEFAFTPLDISETLYEKVLKDRHSTILTSATMRIGDSFQYILNRAGLARMDMENVHSVAVGSPFNYPRQMQFITYHRPPEKGDSESIGNLLINIAGNFNKGILVLFTSYSALSAVRRRIKNEFQKAGITLLAQGMGGSRTSLLDCFRKEKASVLLGTSSFWEGVDVVGDALEILIITKMPFPVPSEPIIEANVEKIRKSGGNPFNEYYIPESVLKFRQGIGRLIRSNTDRGVVINLDQRIDTKSYGRFFKASVPVKPITIRTLESLKREMELFFNE